MDDGKIERLRVLWGKGRHMYSSFFAEVSEVRKEVGDDHLADWCFDELQISLSIIYNVSDILKKADADRVKMELAPAHNVEQARKREAALAARAARIKYAQEKARVEAETAAYLAAKAKSEDEADKAKANLQRRIARRETLANLSPEQRAARNTKLAESRVTAKRERERESKKANDSAQSEHDGISVSFGS